MALITCPECKRQGVSDTAQACPGCGAKLAVPGASAASVSPLGVIAIIVGMLICLGSALGGMNIFSFALGLIFIVIGWFARRPRSS